MSDALRLFDNFKRTDTTPAEYQEPVFNAWNRLAWKNAARIREVLEDWFSTYPPQNKHALVSRFRSKRDDNHQGAFFELFLFQLLTRLGYTVTVNPRMPSGQTPDFVANPQSGECFCLEATVSQPETFQDSPSEKQVLDELNRLRCPDYSLAVRTEGTLNRTPPLKKIRDCFQAWIDSLNYWDVQALWANNQTLPTRSYTYGAWTLKVEAIPRSPDKRGRAGARPVGLGPDRGGVVDSAKPIWNAIHKKLISYRAKDFGTPFIVAVNALDLTGVDRIDMLLALFGWEADTGDSDLAQIIPPHGLRRDNWIWEANKNTGVSAVLLFNTLQPHTMASAPVCLYENPWASHPAPDTLRRLPHAVVEGEFIRWRQGETLGTILGLPADWPGPK